MATLHLRVKGKVQGVFYRASAREAASAIGITGWVRNTPEGDVEAMVTGTDQQVDLFVQWCRRGPSNAVVTEVEATPAPATNFDGFRIVR